MKLACSYLFYINTVSFQLTREMDGTGTTGNQNPYIIGFSCLTPQNISSIVFFCFCFLVLKMKINKLKYRYN